MPEIQTAVDDCLIRNAITEILDADTARTGLSHRPVSLTLELLDGGQIVGGLQACTNWDWLYIETLAVDFRFRSLGLGRQLVAEAERIAMERDCVGAWVDTFTFQSPQFYQCLGYTEFGRLPNYPAGHSRVFLRKMFAAEVVG